MLSLFGCKNCKNRQGELAQLRDEMIKLKTENQRLLQELQQAQQNLVSSPAAPEVTQPTLSSPPVASEFIQPKTVESKQFTLVPIPVAPRQATAPKVVYIASWSRKHFHRPDCVWMENLLESKLRKFSSHEEAVNAGYRPCKTCCA